MFGHCGPFLEQPMSLYTEQAERGFAVGRLSLGTASPLKILPVVWAVRATRWELPGHILIDHVTQKEGCDIFMYF